MTKLLLPREPYRWKGGGSSLLEEDGLSPEIERGGMERQSSRHFFHLLSHHEDCIIFLQVLL